MILYILYNLLISFGFSVWSVENETMQNSLKSGDRLLFASYTFPGMVKDKAPFKRGDIVLIDFSQSVKNRAALRVFDGILRFFTAQRLSISGRNPQVFVKRIIGLPGDELSMNNFIFRVKAAQDPFSLTEFEMADMPYHPIVPQVPALWDDSIPFSGVMESISLGPGEYFAVSDDRSNTNDSRTWGPVPPELIRAKAVFRFWPVTRIGRP